MKLVFNSLSIKNLRIFISVVTIITLIPSVYMFINVMVLEAQGNDECLWLYDEQKKIHLITRVVKGGVADQAKIKDGDYLVKINGKSFTNRNDAIEMLNRVPLNSYATYTILRDGKQFDVKIKIIKVFDFVYLSLFLLGFGFLVVGYIVGITKPTGELQRRFWIFGLVTMIYFGVQNPGIVGTNPITLYKVNPQFASNYYWTFKGIMNLITWFTFFLARLIAPPIFILFFTRFPIDTVPKNRKLLNLILIGSTTFLWLVFVLSFYKILNTPIPQGALIFLFNPTIFFTFGLSIFIYVYLSKSSFSFKEQLRPIVVSIGVSLLTFTYLLILNITRSDAIFTNPILLTPTLLFIGLPVSFGFSIFKHGLMDIDSVVRRSLIYGGLTATMAAIYLLTVVGVGNFLENSFGLTESRMLNIIALLAIAFALDPMKRRAQDAIDRIFYQEKLNYQKALLEFSRELPSKIHIREILQTTMQRITSTMHVETVVAAMFDNFTMESIIPPDYYTPDSEEGSLYNLMAERKTPLYFADKDAALQSRLNPTEYERIIGFGIALSIPMILKDKLIGTINVGRKLNGKPFSQEDIDLLLTVASQAAVAIENARLHLGELEKVKIQEEFALARSIQKQLLPKYNPEILGLDLCGTNEPALVVGGDYYDFISISPTKLLVVVADVSGKGMSAALYMSKIQGMMHLAAHLYTSPKEILTHVNRHLYSTLDRKSFISLILALFDTETQTVTICRAGQSLPLICLNDTFEYVHSSGLALGLVKGDLFAQKLEEISIPFIKNNVIIFYTDGVTESHNSNEEQFGEEYLLNLVNSMKDLTAKDIEAGITNAVVEFQGNTEQHDDRTIVIVRST
ncbi:MAG: SpoIIE family protein phosphatase [Bacteroidetes bacterium]|nr:SpoIIE family protein phosphatase [Bacteroidota bacterium]